MDFKELLKGKNIFEFEDIGENWYSRLNNLKEKYGSPVSGIKNKKAERIIFELIDRLQKHSIIYFQVTQPLPPFPKGRP